MVKIFIDTTELKAEPCRLSKSFAQLTQLAISGFLEIHFSRINISEVDSWINEFIKKQETLVLEAISKATNFGLSDNHHNTINTFSVNNTEWFKKTAKDASTSFHVWLENTRAKIHEIEPADGNNVMNAYFSGQAPFRQVKERNDIPDAFIWQSLNRLNEENEEIFFVSADKIFRNRVSDNLINFKVFTSLKDLFEQPQLLKLVAEWDKSSKQAYTEALIEMIKSELEIQKSDIKSEVGNRIADHIVGMHLNENIYGSQGQIIEVRMTDLPDIELDYVQMTPSPNLYMNFDVEVEVTVLLALPLGDMKKIDTFQKIDRIFENDEYSTDTHVRGESYLFLRAYGEIVIELPTLDEGSGKDEVIDALEECEIRISKVKIENLS